MLIKLVSDYSPSMILALLAAAPCATPGMRRPAPALPGQTRRAALALFGACPACIAAPASALQALVPPATTEFDVQRPWLADVRKARDAHARGRSRYEAALMPLKEELFAKLRAALPSRGASVVEVGVGSFVNAPLYLAPDAGAAPASLDLIGIDPNDQMAAYAWRSDRRARFTQRGNSLRIVHGVAEALPLADGCADALVSTLVLCSVRDVDQALAEVRRVLRPGGVFAFLEHVLSETSEELAKAQARSLTQADRSIDQSSPPRARPPAPAGRRCA